MTAGRRNHDPVPAQRRHRRAPIAALLGAALAWIGACGTNDAIHGGGLPPVVVEAGPPLNPLCTPGSQGCPCTKDGATAACGRVDSRSGNYVTCSMGSSTCTAGTWGPCVGNTIVTKSLPNVWLTTRGIQVLSVTSPCTDVCDPNPDCTQIQSGPDDVDAGGFQPGADGGVTLQDATIPLDAGCFGLVCDIAQCAGNVTTTLSGTVYDPAGNNPLYNASVYIPANPYAALPAFSSGASCDTCSGAGALDAIQATTTDASGNFTLTNVPTLNNLPVVVQMGKWRREIVLKTITSCQGNSVTGNCTAPNPADCMFRLPKNHTDGYDPIAGTYTKADMPQVAIISGSADPFDCLLLKAGIDPNEFSDWTSTKRFHYFQSNQGGGNVLDPAYGMNVAGNNLWDNTNAIQMSNYDAILLPCEGGSHDKQAGTSFTPYQNLIAYADMGGRVFTTHFGYNWLGFPSFMGYVAAPDNWSSLANWAPTGANMTSTVDTQDPLTGVVNTGFPKGAVYSQWLQNLGATNVPSQLTIHEGRQDLTTLGKDPQSWMMAHDTVYASAPDYTNLFTFNTPLGAAPAAQCGRVVYSDFHVSAAALVGTTNQCISNVDCGFGATCVGSTGGSVGQCSEPCGTTADCPNSSFTCAGATTGTCGQTSCTSNGNCGTGRACLNHVCECAGNSDCNGGTCSGMTCTQISCTSSSQCGNGTCGGGTCTSVTCHSNADCGLGTCGGTGHTGTCAAGTSCHSNAQCGTNGTCGTGTNAVAGKCTTSAQICHKNTDCDSSSCGTGTGSAKGTCANGASHVCHSNTDCDSNSCGTGSGATAGTCTNGNATVCHKNTDCDSNSCGAGGGSTLGTCNSNGATCHASSTCDSGSCTGGVCSNGTGHACHANTDCDGANACGLGAKGTCSTGTATTCHSSAQCDSGVCGSGAGGSLKGHCTAGACTGAGQCGTGGTCTGGVCTAGSCSADTACGTSGGVCTGATCTASAANSCSGDAACTASHLCNGATCGAAPACGADTSCPSSGLCNNAKCTNLSCSVDTACTVSGLCNSAKCSTPATCAGDAACPSSHTCNNAKCSTPATCAGDVACPSSNLCTGSKCSNATCQVDTNCTVAGSICSGATCDKASCNGDSDCPSGVTCSGAKCTTVPCGTNADCGTGGVCSNTKCSASACASSADCGAGSICGGTCTTPTCTQNTDCASGICSGGTCGCVSGENCGGSQTCNGASPGTCSRACTQNSDCAPDLCVNGQCGGCTNTTQCHDNGFSASCGGISPSNYGTCSVFNSGEFPEACRQGTLSSQEKALEFMFFDLTSCVSPDNAVPPPPPTAITGYPPATFTEDFTASCTMIGTVPEWREFDWQAQIPPGANITISAQTGNSTTTLLPATPLLVDTATTSTNTGPMGTNFDVALLETGPKGTGAFDTANPPVVSGSLLRVTITLNPTPDYQQAPTLNQWRVQYDCVPME